MRHADPTVREALLEAARREFADHSLLGARIEDVCRRAGISKGAFYLHFRSKEDVFREILQRFLGTLEEHAKRRAEAVAEFTNAVGVVTGSDRAKRSPRFQQAFSLELQCDVELLDLFWRNRQIISALDGASSKWYWQLITDFRRRMTAIAITNLEERTIGSVRADIPSEFIAEIVVSAYEGLVRRMVHLSAKPDFVAWTRNLLTMVYEGITGCGAAAAPSVRSIRKGSRKNDQQVIHRR